MKFVELTNELLQDFSSSLSTAANEPFDNLWGVLEQELVRYSLTLAPDCKKAVRTLVSRAVIEISHKKSQSAVKKGQAKIALKAMGLEPTIAIAPYVYPYIVNEPTRYLVYGIQMHKGSEEELAEVSVRMLALAMIKTAKENGEKEITKQSLNTIKEWFCPMWPFWQQKDC